MTVQHTLSFSYRLLLLVRIRNVNDQSHNTVNASHHLFLCEPSVTPEHVNARISFSQLGPDDAGWQLPTLFNNESSNFILFSSWFTFKEPSVNM